MSYCNFVAGLPKDTLDSNKAYHDHHYGFEIESDTELFGRLILEINQAGLSWTTILKKQSNFYKAYDGYDISCVAQYDQEQIDRLLSDVGIIRNRLKVQAVIYNAKQILLLQEQYGSFKNWLDQHVGLNLEQWVALFKKHFKFVGKEIVNEFLMSIGYLPGAHVKTCGIYSKYIGSNPKWL